MPKEVNPIDGQVGNRLRLRRMVMGLSQEKLGEMLGLTFQQVQKYEKGVNRIAAGRLYQLAHILGVPVDYFYEGLPQNGADGNEGNSDAMRVMEFLSGGEGLQLSLAYMGIKDQKVRRRVLDLVRCLAEETSEIRH